MNEGNGELHHQYGNYRSLDIVFYFDIVIFLASYLKLLEVWVILLISHVYLIVLRRLFLGILPSSPIYQLMSPKFPKLLK